jgi:hypothetical protein
MTKALPSGCPHDHGLRCCLFYDWERNRRRADARGVISQYDYLASAANSSGSTGCGAASVALERRRLNEKGPSLTEKK